MSHDVEVSRGERFEFGANWTRFLRLLNDDRIRSAEDALRSMLQMNNLDGKRFLDVGSGSGLMSLAARRLGASVVSFDFDPQSVACTNDLRNRFFAADPDWQVLGGSVLDAAFMRSLGAFDIVYSWGVLHHTGRMWQAIRNAEGRVGPNGLLFIAIYNDQGLASRYWTAVKKLYNRNRVGRLAMTLLHIPNVYVARLVARAVQGRSSTDRGMSLWYDMLDWLGGYPFEVARPEAILEFLTPDGFSLEKLKTCGGRYGCNEFVFRRIAAPR
jgi:2-polyprenyl-3-methyl-5-hydroxy-6-metoxy-1,4-benzoquinol methylase